ncbi:MAG: hypothetical protein JSV91_01485, partial [Phycisphaerales bacterium]
GYGRPLRRFFAPEAEEGLVIQAGLGVAALLVLDAATGALGLLQAGGSIGAWILLIPGWLLLLWQIVRSIAAAGGHIAIQPPHWLVWMSAPALAVLLLACCSAPGWLWHSEFGGYDALSYHLQLPREWVAAGRITGLEHNVYSFLPGYIEAAYYHLAILIGGETQFVYAAQFLHAGLSVLAAIAVSRLAFRVGGSRRRMIAAIAFTLTLSTPWVVVVGSLGYNEMAAALMLAVGLLTMQEQSVKSIRRGAGVGLLAAAACGAKLTAAGFVALPLVILFILTLRGQTVRRGTGAILSGGAAGLICLLPYLLRNGFQTGNPVFPFASGILGLGHWTAEQAAIFRSGHLSDLGLPDRIVEAWHQLLHYGIGPNPYTVPFVEPWHAQWSILPWLTLAGLVICWMRAPLRATAWRIFLILLLQVWFWFFFTHVKSRFMLPAVVPAAFVTAVSLRALTDGLEQVASKRAFTAVVGAVTLAYSCVTVFIFRGEPYAPDEGGRTLRAPAAMIGQAGALSGEDLTAEQRAELVGALPAVYVNYALPADGKVALIGEAAVLYYRGDLAYKTTWDRGPLSLAMQAYPDDPRRWFDSMREQGFTHLLVNYEMLDRWERAGWHDPNLTSDRITEAVRCFARIQRTWPRLRITLYTLTALD